eukprot:46797_1
MAEEKYNPDITKNDAANDKQVHLLIRGCTNPPKDVNVSKKKGTKNGNYLKGMKLDMMNMEALCDKYEYNHFYNAVANNNMTAASVLKEISNACKYAKFNGADWLRIYYTGHGETGTGNWIFKDKTLSLNSIIDTIKTHWASGKFSLYCDCCHSGNWCEQISKYKSELGDVWVHAASWPNTVAYDDPENGGYATQYWTEKKYEKDLKKLYRCVAHVNNNYCSIQYWTPNGMKKDKLV